MENYLRRGIRGARFRVDKRLDRAAISRAHDVLYLSDAWTEATWLGAQALKNPLDLWVYQEIMFETRPELADRDGHLPRWKRLRSSPRCAISSARERSCRSTSSRCGTTIRAIRGSPTSGADPRLTQTSSPRSMPAPTGKRRCVVPRTRTTRRHHVEAELAEYAGPRPGRRLRDRGGLQYRANPRGSPPRPAPGDRSVSRGERTSSRSTARGRSS